MRVVLVVLAVLVVTTLAGCATAFGENLERESARAIIPTPHPDSVKISDYRGGLGGATWVATTPKGVYDCSRQSGERAPLCAKRGP